MEVLKKKSVIITLLLIFTSVALLMVFGFWRQTEGIVMKVNGEKIRSEEFQLYLDYYSREIQEIGNGEENKQVAKELIAEKKVEQQLAFEKGVSESFKFEDLKAQMKTTNENNKKKKDNGEPIYGILKYDLEQFYGYKYNNAVLKLKEKLAEGELEITDSEKHDYYEDNKERLFTEQSGGVYTVIKGKNTEEVKERMKVLKQTEETRREFALLSENVLEKEVMEEVTSEKLRELEKGGYKIAQQMIQTEENEFGEIIEEGQYYWMLYCHKKAEGEVMEFNEVEKVIENRIIDIKYQQYLKEKTKGSNIKIK